MRRAIGATLVAAVAVAVIAFAAADRGLADSQRTHFRATLTGYEETPAVNTSGHAAFALTIGDNDASIDYTLTYADLSGPPAAAHIHFGARSTAAGVSAFLCGGGGKPACPATTSGAVSGTIVAANVVGPAGQGIGAGDLAALVRAIRSGVTYANMHTATFPAGEIRGQIGDEDQRN